MPTRQESDGLTFTYCLFSCGKPFQDRLQSGRCLHRRLQRAQPDSSTRYSNTKDPPFNEASVALATCGDGVGAQWRWPRRRRVPDCVEDFWIASKTMVSVAPVARLLRLMPRPRPGHQNRGCWSVLRSLSGHSRWIVHYHHVWVTPEHMCVVFMAATRA